MAGLFLPGGIATKLLFEDEDSGDYADYALPHGWWHTLMFGGSVWVLGIALIFNRRARTYALGVKSVGKGETPMVELSQV